jgi:hypothetical protein
MTQQNNDGKVVGVKVSSTLKRESDFFITNNKMDITGVIKSGGIATPQDRLKEKFERIKRIREAREQGKVQDFKIEP